MLGKLVIASHNKGKVQEIRELLKPYNMEIISGAEFNLEEPEETGKTFEENSIIKARYFADKTGLPSLADDSGLVIPLLNGDPGIYSARWGGESGDFDLAMETVRKKIEELTGSTVNKVKPKAYFICSLTLSLPDQDESFEGKVTGTLTYPPRGRDGFGYDPIFIPDSYDITFGEMNPDEKQKISHRADAFSKLSEYFKG